jgi:hypothetical protein
MSIGTLNKTDILVLSWWISDLCSKLPNIPFVSVTNKIVWVIVLISIINIPISLRSESSPPPFVKGIFLFFTLVFIYGLCHVLFGYSLYYPTLGRIVPNTENVVGVLTSLAPFFIIYVLSISDRISESQLRLWSLLFLCNAIVAFFSMKYKVLFHDNLESFTNNAGYEFVYLLPFVLFWRNNKAIYFLYQLVILYFVLQSHKRGAILTSVLVCTYYLYAYIKVQILGFRHKLVFFYF